ncbi:hypothetical protein [Puia dinghuensis]|uniref:Uncharacterized protein n=1 Tax=Puia dinghuensis TaxID=1792502 RepID=A0A8J2XW35_9BACT|nr:hypothetical protein [Puia dinghuensis]GGB21203.1 hypothetical protein GCM10011511_51210 [Puia dinghuensis]
MRIVTATIFLIGMLGTCFSSYLIEWDYALNKRFIAANLCVNRGRPELKCEGRCYLCKRLHKENNKDQENSGRRDGFKFLVLSLEGGFHFACFSPDVATVRGGFVPADLPPSPTHSFFHPPRA